MKYLIFLDIDGTTLSRVTGKIHPRTIEAVKEARRRGHKVFINTGRSLSIIPEEILNNLEYDGLVTGLGATVTIDGKKLFSNTMTREQLELAVKITDEIDELLYFEGDNISVTYNGVSPVKGFDYEVASLEDMYERFPDIEIAKLTFGGTIPEDAAKRFESLFSVFCHPTYAELGIPGFSKATGMHYLRDYYGVDDAHIIAMGDSDNDSEMLEAAGIAVIMGNADEVIKPLADFISTTCEEGGVGYAIEKLILEKEDEE